MIIGKQLNIKVTDYCNAACSFCGYNRNDFKHRIRGGYKPFVLDVDKFQNQFEALKKKGFQKLHLTGGEPLMHPMIREFIYAAKIWGFTVQTGTNGSLLDEDMVKFIRDSNIDYLWLSIDTFPIDKHLEHRGFLSIKNKFIRGIKLLQQHNINFFGQTVISNILPRKQGKLNIEGHIDYYYQQFGMNRFVFCYPMYRPDLPNDHTHLAALGSDSVYFDKQELHDIYHDLIEIKLKNKHIQIVNPYLSLWQQKNELNGGGNEFGCYAGREIFFLGEDQATLRPCYFFADQVVDNIDENPLQYDSSYESCTECQDQCYRDPSIVYFVKHRPLKFVQNMLKHPELINYSLKDIWNVVKHGMYRHP